MHCCTLIGRMWKPHIICFILVNQSPEFLTKVSGRIDMLSSRVHPKGPLHAHTPAPRYIRAYSSFSIPHRPRANASVPRCNPSHQFSLPPSPRWRHRFAAAVLIVPPVSDAGWRKRKRKASPRSSPLETCFPLVPPLPSPSISLRSTWTARRSHFYRLHTKKSLVDGCCRKGFGSDSYIFSRKPNICLCRSGIERFNPSKPLHPPKFVALASSLKGSEAVPSFLMIAPSSSWIPIPVVRFVCLFLPIFFYLFLLYYTFFMIWIL